MKYMRWDLLWTLFTTITLGKTREAPLGLDLNDIIKELTTLPEVPVHEIKGIIRNANHVIKLPQLSGISSDPKQLKVKEENGDKFQETFENRHKRVVENVDSEFGHLINNNDDYSFRNADENFIKRNKRNDVEKPSEPSSKSDDASILDKDESEYSKKRERRSIMSRPSYDSYDTEDDYNAETGSTNRDEEQDYDDPMSYETKETYKDIHEKNSKTKKLRTNLSISNTDAKRQISQNSMLTTNESLPKTKISKNNEASTKKPRAKITPTRKNKVSTKKPHSRTKATKTTKKPKMKKDILTKDDELQLPQEIKFQIGGKKTYSFPNKDNKFLLTNNAANDKINTMGKQLLDVMMNINKCECNDKNIANSLCCYLRPYQNRQVEVARNKPKDLQKAISKLNKNDKYIKEHDEHKHTVSLSRSGYGNRMDRDENYSAFSMQQVQEEDNHNSVDLEDVSNEVNDYSYYIDKMQKVNNDNSAPIEEENIDTHNFKSLIDYILL